MFSKKIQYVFDLAALNQRNQVQTLKASGNQPRPGNLSPNLIALAGGPNLPAHVSEVRAVTVKSNDSTSKVTVTFSRNPNDYQFVDARVFVSGYKGNPAPVQVASGQSPVSFALENTGEPVAVTVQASGNLGQAALSTAPTTTLQLVKTPLATTSTPSGNGTGGATLQVNSVNNASQSLLNLTDSSTVLFTDNGSGSVSAATNGYLLKRTQVTLTSTQLKNLTTTPITLIPAQGSNTMIVPVELFLEYVFGTSAYAATGTLTFYFGASNATNFWFNPVNVSGFLNQTASMFASAPPANSSTLTQYVSKANGANSDLKIGNSAAAIATGDGTLVCTVYYRVETIT
jgi:hypothetical protein